MLKNSAEASIALMGKGIRQAGARSATRPVPSAVKAVDYKLYCNLCISLIVTACAIYYARDEGSAGTDGSLFKRGHGNAVSFSQPPSPGVTGATQHRGEKGASAPARRNVKQRGVRGRPRTLEDQRAALKQVLGILCHSSCDAFVEPSSFEPLLWSDWHNNGGRHNRTRNPRENQPTSSGWPMPSNAGSMR